MVDKELIKTVAYCGLICGVCSNTEKGCNGCRNGGGDDDCYQRICCTRKGIEGCWQCETFPCDKGYFADKEWQGICLGFVQCIKDKGIEDFASLVLSRLGNRIEYGEFRFKDEHEIVTMLQDTGT